MGGAGRTEGELADRRGSGEVEGDKAVARPAERPPEDGHELSMKNRLPRAGTSRGFQRFWTEGNRDSK